jgi:hypothetical protein
MSRSGVQVPQIHLQFGRGCRQHKKKKLSYDASSPSAVWTRLEPTADLSVQERT